MKLTAFYLILTISNNQPIVIPAFNKDHCEVLHKSYVEEFSHIFNGTVQGVCVESVDPETI